MTVLQQSQHTGMIRLEGLLQDVQGPPVERRGLGVSLAGGEEHGQVVQAVLRGWTCRLLVNVSQRLFSSRIPPALTEVWTFITILP